MTTTVANKQNTSSAKVQAFKNLLEMVKEFELMYNLSPEISKSDQAKLMKKILNVLGSSTVRKPNTYTQNN